jgi:hypothetical protein
MSCCVRDTGEGTFVETYGYEEISKSELLPQLDISLLVRCVLIPDSIQAGNEFDQNI